MSKRQHCLQLISALGKHVGIPELTLGESDGLAMGFDDVTVVFQYDAELDLIIAYGAVGEMPQRPGLNLMRAIMALNTQSLLTGPGAIGTDEAAGKFLYVERIYPKVLDEEGFVKLVEGLVARFDIMRATISAPDFGAETDERFGQPDGPDDMVMMRL